MDGPNGPIPLFVGSIPTAAFNLFKLILHQLGAANPTVVGNVVASFLLSFAVNESMNLQDRFKEELYLR